MLQKYEKFISFYYLKRLYFDKRKNKEVAINYVPT